MFSLGIDFFFFCSGCVFQDQASSFFTPLLLFAVCTPALLYGKLKALNTEEFDSASLDT